MEYYFCMENERLYQKIKLYAELHDKTVSSVINDLLRAINFLKEFMKDTTSIQPDTEDLYRFLMEALYSMLPVN